MTISSICYKESFFADMPWKFEVAAIILSLKKNQVISHKGHFPKSHLIL